MAQDLEEDGTATKQFIVLYYMMLNLSTPTHVMGFFFFNIFLLGIQDEYATMNT